MNPANVSLFLFAAAVTFSVFHFICDNTTLLPGVNIIALEMFLWCQIHSSHSHASHETLNYNNESKRFSQKLINK